MSEEIFNSDKLTSNFAIPGKKEVFQALVSGMHISLFSGELYRFLQEHYQAYEIEFKTLGYTLIHEQDYYYLQSQNENKSNDFSQRALVFICIMLEAIANEGVDVVESFFSSHGFNKDQLPHFKTERYRNYMQHMDINEERQLTALLKNMKRSGFIEYHDSDNVIRFLSPCNRFLKVSLEILDKHQQGKSE